MQETICTATDLTLRHPLPAQIYSLSVVSDKDWKNLPVVYDVYLTFLLLLAQTEL
jgi:hypothetical protein